MALVYNPQTGQYENQSQQPDPAAQARATLFGGNMSATDIQSAIASGYLSYQDLTDFNSYQHGQNQNQQDAWNMSQTTGYDASGRPVQKDFESMIDPATGLLKGPLSLGDGGLNSDALEQMRTEATRTGPSAWRTLSETAANDGMAKQIAGSTQQGLDQLAMTGGLRGGSAERLASQGMQAAITGKQDNANKFAMADETNRQQAVKDLSGQELAYAGYGRDTEKYNIDKTLAESLQQRGYDINRYNQAMSAWGAERTAAATPSGGGGGKK